MKRTIGKTLGMIALATGIASIGSGCQTTPQGYNFGAGMVNQAVGSYISGQLDPKGTNVTVNNYPNSSQAYVKQEVEMTKTVLRPGDSSVIKAPGYFNGERITKVLGYVEEDSRMKFIFNDNGNGSDAIAGDNVWSSGVSVPNGAPKGNFSVKINGYNTSGVAYTSEIDFTITD